MNPAGQSKRHSLFESGTNILIGYSIAVMAQILIFPMFGIRIAFHEHNMIALFFTGISFLRSYLIRRMWNWVHVHQINPRREIKLQWGNLYGVLSTGYATILERVKRWGTRGGR